MILDKGVVLCQGSVVGEYARIGRDSEVGYNGVVDPLETQANMSFVAGDGSCTGDFP